MKLNDKACKSLKPKDTPYKKADGGGLYLDIKPSGSKLWRFKYRFNGKEKLLSFGSYPLISLAEARDKREEAKKLLLQGTDPSLERKKEKMQKSLNSENTFEVIAREWWENKKSGWTERHGKYNLRRLEQNIFPEIGYLPIKDIIPMDILNALKKIEGRGAHDVASRCKTLCSQVFRYAIITSRANNDPTFGLQDALQPYEKTNYNAIGVKDLPEFVRTLHSNKARLFPHTLLATEMLMLTFVRTSELIEATWDEFDFEKKVWEIPAERMKMNRAHVVPLSPRVLDILEELKELSVNSKYIFPSQTNPRNHMSNNTILKALERLGYKGRMTGHGFRALAMTAIKEELGYRHEIVDLQLAHMKKSKIDAAYDRTTFIKERTKMMQDWDNYIHNLQSHGKVIKAKFGS